MLPEPLRRLTHDIAREVWREVAPELIEAQVLVESGGDPLAISPAGAVGLMQIMPATARELGVAEELLTDPETNLRAGVRYLSEQFSRFPEVSIYHERLSFALASYNGGRGYVNRALALAREDCGCPNAETPGAWQRWEIAGPYLLHRDCAIRRQDRAVPRYSRPDGAQMLLYVARVRATFSRLAAA